MENLEIYNQLRSVPKEAQKDFNNGRFAGTDINPMWRIKKLTEVFGVAGFGWYTEIVHRHIDEASDGAKCAFVGINLYVKIGGEWSKPIYGEGGNTFESKSSKGYTIVSDEAYKMAYTDALGIAAKALGLGADVWFGQDKTKYTAGDQQQTKPVQASKPAPKAEPAQAAAPVQQAQPKQPITREVALARINDNMQKYFATFEPDDDSDERQDAWNKICKYGQDHGLVYDQNNQIWK